MLLTSTRPAGDLLDVDVRVTCSSGTYVRALARDLGTSLGVGGHLTRLRRTRVGGFDLGAAHTLEALAEEFVTIPLAQAVRDAFVSVDVAGAEADGVCFGRGVAIPDDLVLAATAGGASAPVGVFGPDGDVLALMEVDGHRLRPLVVFVAR